MSLTPRELFKYGFLLACQETGYDPRQAVARCLQAGEKQAFDWGKFIPSPAGLSSGLGSLMLGGSAILGSGIGLAGVGGAGAGYLAAKLMGQEPDPEELKTQELIAAYQQAADRARRNARVRYTQPAAKNKRAPRTTVQTPQLRLGGS